MFDFDSNRTTKRTAYGKKSSPSPSLHYPFPSLPNLSPSFTLSYPVLFFSFPFLSFFPTPCFSFPHPLLFFRTLLLPYSILLPLTFCFHSLSFFLFSSPLRLYFHSRAPSFEIQLGIRASVNYDPVLIWRIMQYCRRVNSELVGFLSVQVLVKDPTPTESCTTVLDPHITTFDGQ